MRLFSSAFCLACKYAHPALYLHRRSAPQVQRKCKVTGLFSFDVFETQTSGLPLTQFSTFALDSSGSMTIFAHDHIGLDRSECSQGSDIK